MLFIFACEAAGALGARHSLRPLSKGQDMKSNNPGKSRRGNAHDCLNVIARSTCDEAIHLPASPRQNWIASLRSQ
jgi:hypothetical protein